jgi:hypothetical protein
VKLANLWAGHLSSLALFALRSQRYLVVLYTAAALIRKALDRDNIAEPFKIPGVMGQQAGDVINQHGGDDIGVVDLLAADRIVPHQFKQLPGDGGGVVCHFKLSYQLADLRQYRGLGQGAKGLWPGERGHVFADYLTAKPKRPA